MSKPTFHCALLLAAVVLTPLTAFAFWPQSVGAQSVMKQSSAPVYQQRERVLTVTGVGIESIPTTLTQVTLGVVVEAATAEEAQQQAAQRQTAVVEWLRSQSVEKLETTGISLSPRYDYRNDRQVLRGYEASNTVRFRAETESAGEIIDGAVREGATRINGISFVADDAAIEAARQRALTAAVEDAQLQSDTVLGALGLSSQEVINITIGSVSAPPPSPVAARAVAEDAQFASTPIVGQSQEINARVTLDIRY
ncbi:MAG: SIMPL domain-containing protein [Cyanobacteria bacterium J06623_5]